MSHASGIVVHADLAATFTQERESGTKRAIKCQIVEDKLEETVRKDAYSLPVRLSPAQGSFAPESDFVTDMDKLPGLLDEKEPCYLLYRLDEKSSEFGFNFLFMTYVPDRAPIKRKMLYSSTKETTKLTLGNKSFTEDIHGTEAADFDTKAWRQYIGHKEAAVPETEAERQYKQEAKMETASTIAVTLQFPFVDEAQAKIQDLVAKRSNCVVLRIDPKAENIQNSFSGTVDDLEAVLRQHGMDEPRFVFFDFAHRHEDKDCSERVFIYWSPENAPIKQKMLGSSVKTAVEAMVAAAGFESEKKLELHDFDEVTHGALYLEVHPPPVEKKKAFAKPSRPGRARGKK